MEFEKEYDFEDTMMSEPDEEEFFDTSEKILNLSDRLAEEIILDNIEDQLNSEVDTLNTRINYVSLFKEKYSEIDPSDGDYVAEYIQDSLIRVADVVGAGLKARYEVELGDDLDYTAPAVYLNDMETLYEFLFIRQYTNLVDYFEYKLKENKEGFLSSYRKLMNETDTHSKDLFVVQSKKKFKNEDDVVIMHFINEIIDDIKSSCISSYTLFTEICNLDKFEEFNNRMSELLINYGNKIILNNDSETAKLYFKPLENKGTYSDIRNKILMDYLESCELDD